MVRRVDPPPDRVLLDAVPAPPDHRVLRLGLCLDEQAAVLHDPRDGSALLVAGPARSGRSTALVLLAQQLSPGPLATICPRRSLLLDLAASRAVHLPAHDQVHAVALLDELSGPGGQVPHVLVDDAELLEDGPLTDRLCRLARGARDGHNVVVLAGLTDALAAAFRGPVTEVRRARAGLLLWPAGVPDGELLGVRLPRRNSRRDPPGRGWWALAGEATALQVALPPRISRLPLPAAGSARPAPARPTGPCSVRPASTRTEPGRPR
jgi:S-DNA-T family DNA segregation ATPase FtsK/SpoIIIE